MKIISRDSLHKNLVITALSIENNYISTENKYSIKKTITYYDEIIKSIDHVKEYLINVKNCKPGQKITSSISYWPSYVIWFYACAELGLTFVVSDYPKSEITISKLSIYGEISFMIQDEPVELFEKNYPDKIINVQEINNYNYSGNPTPIWASDDTVILLATSSGTTGTPKVIDCTHEWFYDAIEREEKIYQLKEDDKCFHSKGLYHGSICQAYFLPVMKYCAYHYHAPFKFIKCSPGQFLEAESPMISAWIDLFQKEKINRCLMFSDQLEILNKFLKIENKQHDDMTMFILSNIKKEEVNNLVGNFGYKILSIFGCQEIKSFLFLPEINLDNYKTYDPTCMGKPVDDFLKLSIDNENFIIVEMPDGSKIKTGDKFKIVNDDYYFLGRDDVYRLKGKPLYLDLLNEVIEKITNLKRNIEFDIVVDSKEDSIYIRLNEDKDLNYINYNIQQLLGSGIYNISKKIVSPRSNFFSGIKFDPESIRITCRQI